MAKFHCKSDAQKKAIRRSYAKKAEKNGADLVVVPIKTHNDRNGGHPHIIMDDIDDKHVSVGITHDKKKGKNATNYTMERDPLGGKKTSYMRRQGIVAPKNEYSGLRSGEMTPKDYAKAKEYSEKAKCKYAAKKDKKK